ncbi:MAG TPA: cysteine desulfurase [Bacteroidales bacterium]|nr:cysteine desulfurase [Bacteroidales bacterium]
MGTFPVNKIREDFPILHQMVYGRPLVYFDNAASTQKPVQVIRAISGYYETDNCNIHRGVHFLSQRATEAYEETRKVVQRFINAASSSEIIFTKGTTESINLVASSFGKQYISSGDEVLISIMEHHSNIVPWQQMCLERGAKVKFIPIHENGELDMGSFRKMLNEKTKLVAITHVSNVLGTINPVKEIIAYAHTYGIPVLVDGAQSIPHLGADMHDLDCDFYCFSGHKMYAPMGIGVLYGKEKFLEALPPYQSGGEMIKEVHTDRTTFNELPFKFEAGTPNVEGVYGLHAAIGYLQGLGMENIRNYEHEILKYATDKLTAMGDIHIIGTAEEKTSLISFLIGTIHPYDAGVIIDKMGIAVRTGHHCAMPLIEWYKIPATVRASFAFYNTVEEIDSLVEAIIRVKQMFG